MTLFRPSFPWGGDLGRAGPYISMQAPDTTGVIPDGSNYRDSQCTPPCCMSRIHVGYRINHGLEDVTG